MDDFSVRLFYWLEFQEVALEGESGLLGELALGGSERFFVVDELTLGDGPRGGVFLRPQWSAEVDEEDFESPRAFAIEEYACAGLLPFGFALSTFAASSHWACLTATA